MSIELSDKDRLFLANQYEILAALNKGSNAARYAELSRNLNEGHKGIYENQLESQLSPVFEEHEFVLDVLAMFRALSRSFENLADKSGIDPQDVRYSGFDGNNETEHLSFADALFRNGRFVETIRTEGLNSHSQTIGMYQRMLTAWQMQGRAIALSKEQVVQIVGAHSYPE
ncbi:YfbU family protein [Herbaspirillum sp. 1130]|uniref:YfbU family protein n=1 Tax=Herbaspirillum sp. 1130 TaxID=2806562 RepID=UPI001AE4339F|nr:YfbU family protein [Herbaspirillum sp. 1130]MBP1317775.1 uncharacterized protein YfbU (UPF0304 family) [Herbaspirillum sp. 1130]